MNHRILHKAGVTPTPSLGVSGVSTSGLPADLLQEASRRLGWAGLIYSATFFFAFFGGTFMSVRAGMSLGEYYELQMAVSVASIALGLAILFLAHFARIRPEVLLDLGLVFEVVGAFGIAMSSYWGIWPEFSLEVLEHHRGIPWECVWIIIFPLLAPNTPGKVLLASLAAASMGPLTFALSKAFGATSPDVPMLLVFGFYATTTYLCAGLAFVIAHVVYRYGRRLKRARDIGSYQLVKPLGAGGMGEVWLAKHRMLARPAAVKLIRPEALGTDEGDRVLLRDGAAQRDEPRPAGKAVRSSIAGAGRLSVAAGVPFTG
jgi:serine/threonine-protein kinase